MHLSTRRRSARANEADNTFGKSDLRTLPSPPTRAPHSSAPRGPCFRWGHSCSGLMPRPPIHLRCVRETCTRRCCSLESRPQLAFKKAYIQIIHWRRFESTLGPMRRSFSMKTGGSTRATSMGRTRQCCYLGARTSGPLLPVQWEGQAIQRCRHLALFESWYVATLCKIDTSVLK